MDGSIHNGVKAGVLEPSISKVCNICVYVYVYVYVCCMSMHAV